MPLRRFFPLLLLLPLLFTSFQPAQADAPAAPPDPAPPLPATAYMALRYAPLAAPAPGLDALRTFPETRPTLAPLQPRPDDPWTSFDKVQHLTFSFLITLGGQYTLVNKLSMAERRALPLSMGAGAAVGLAKEYYDGRYGARRFFSRRDLAADALGIALAAGLILL